MRHGFVKPTGGGWVGVILLLEKLRRWMIGRRGVDSLSIALVIAGLVLSLLGRLTNLWALMLLSYLPYFYAIFRILSRNLSARQREWAAFVKWQTGVQGFFSLKKRQWTERKLYRYFSCPNCRQKLRAPKGRGKIQVTCQKCKTAFIKKT